MHEAYCWALGANLQRRSRRCNRRTLCAGCHDLGNTRAISHHFTGGHQDLFIEAARAGLRVKLQTYVLSPVSETCVINAGHDEFLRAADGQTAVFPARYSFVLVRLNGAWMIAHQHSSILPKPAGG